MTLKPAICTQCGGQIEVNPSQEAGICSICKTAFITEKVISNYTTNVSNTINNSVSMAGANIAHMTVQHGVNVVDGLLRKGLICN